MLYNRFTAGIFIAFLLLLSIVSKNGASAKTVDEVLLTSHDGTFEISGVLLAANSDVYMIKTRLGEIVILAKNVICRGDACPFLPHIVRLSDEVIDGSVDFLSQSVPSYVRAEQLHETEAGPFRLVSD